MEEIKEETDLAILFHKIEKLKEDTKMKELQEIISRVSGFQNTFLEEMRNLDEQFKNVLAKSKKDHFTYIIFLINQ
jgi:hypothetical protein